MLALCGATFALLLTAALAAATCSKARDSAYALAVYLVAWAEIVVLGEVLAVPNAANATGYAIGEGVLLVVALATWHLRGRPRPPRVVLRPVSWRAHPLLVALALAVGVGLIYQAFIVVATPPNNFDSMTYHLSRVAAWYQDGGIHQLAAHTSRQNLMPPNSELAVLYSFVFLGRDTLAAAPHSSRRSPCSSRSTAARDVSVPRSGALFAALTTATLTEFALQSVTTQNDLVVAAFVVVAAYFLLGRSRRELPLAGLALALALGTKPTAVFALPVLGLVALAVFPRRRLLELAAWSAAAFVAVGAYGYARNFHETGHPLPSGPEFTNFQPRITTTGTISTSARVLYRFVDLSGYHVPLPILGQIYGRGESLFRALHIRTNPPEATSRDFTFFPTTTPDEDKSYFGLLGLFLVLPLAFGYAGALALRKTSMRAGCWACTPLFVLAIALSYTYNPWIGRFMLIPVALVMPLAAGLYRLRLVSGLAVAVAILTLGVAHAYNLMKPTGIGGGRAVWSMSRAEAQGLASPLLDAAVTTLDRRIPAHARVGIVFGGNEWDYPVYGTHLDRLVSEFPSIHAATQSSANWLVLGLDYPVAGGAASGTATFCRTAGRCSLGAPSARSPRPRLSRLLQSSEPESRYFSRGRRHRRRLPRARARARELPERRRRARPAAPLGREAALRLHELRPPSSRGTTTSRSSRTSSCAAAAAAAACTSPCAIRSSSS